MCDHHSTLFTFKIIFIDDLIRLASVYCICERRTFWNERQVCARMARVFCFDYVVLPATATPIKALRCVSPVCVSVLRQDGEVHEANKIRNRLRKSCFPSEINKFRLREDREKRQIKICFLLLYQQKSPQSDFSMLIIVYQVRNNNTDLRVEKQLYPMCTKNSQWKRAWRGVVFIVIAIIKASHSYC